MQSKIPMMVIGNTHQRKKVVKVVEVAVSAVEYSKGEHYNEALQAAFEKEGVVGPMVALAPEDALQLTDAIGTMKQFLLGTQAIAEIGVRTNKGQDEKMSKIA